MAFRSYEGVLTELKEEDEKIVVRGTLIRSGFSGHNAMLVFQNKPKVKAAIGNRKKYEVTFGCHPGGNMFQGKIKGNVAQPANKKDQVVIPVELSDLLEISFWIT